MKTVFGELKSRLEPGDILGGAYVNQTVTLHGAVHSLRKLGGVSFLTLRGREGVLQCVCPPETDLTGLCEECALLISGVIQSETRAPGGFELHVSAIKVLSRPAAPPPVSLSKQRLNMSLDTELAFRPVVLRSLRERSVFQIQAGVTRAFRDFLHTRGFTEIHTPKIVHAGAEGGSSIFKLDYFGHKACLAQSPQFYKQTMVGVFERVFEAAPVFRAEKHATPRHLNEYTSLDLEMGYIDSFYDIIELETGFFKYCFHLLRTEYAGDLARLGVELPELRGIPCVRFDEAKRLASRRYGYQIRDPYDLEPDEEQRIGQYAREEWDSNFVFITHYPGKKRPFYALDDRSDPRYTLSFDLLYKGMEITTGGQRIHDYRQQVEKMERLGMDPEDFQSYLMAHKHGLPPHGGLGIGLERLTMKLCALDNVRSACLFPRDRSRLEP